MTPRNNPAAISALRQSVGIKDINAEDDRNQADLDDYVKTRCSQEPIASKLEAAGKTGDSIVSVLREKSGGKFLYAVRALNDIANENLKLDDLETLPPGMDGFYLDSFNRRFGANPKDYQDIRDALGVLASAREPVVLAMLAGVLGRDETAVKQALALINY